MRSWPLLCVVALACGCARGPRGTSVAPEPRADLILVDAIVDTQDPDAPRAEAIAIADGALLSVGTAAEALRTRGPETRVVSLPGRMVLPGFIDSHVHPVTGGVELLQCNLNEAETRDGLFAAIDACDEQQAGPWIVGGGWALTLFDDANPTAAQLDAIVAHRPVYLTAADAHSAWVNTAALQAAGITADTADPPGGRIERDAAGAPTGTLRESAMALVEPLLPPVTRAQRLEGLRRALAMAHRYGITTLQEANADPEVLDAYLALADAGELTARVVVAQQVTAERGPEQLAALVAARDAIEHPRLRATSIKIFADGVIEGRTAALLEPYLGTGSRGELLFSEPQLRSIVGAADLEGLDVHVHAIGDRAIRASLDAVEAAIADNPPWDRRHMIAHLQLIDPADIPRFAALGVIASFQPLWAYPDEYITELTVPVLGPERSRWLYPIGSVMRTGATVAAGSDWSVSSMNPLHGVQVAVTRRAVDDPPGPPWIPDETVALADILAAYTRAGAWASRSEGRVGMLRAGMRADLVVLEADLHAQPQHRIAQVEVVATLVDGAVVYGALGS